MEGSPLTGIRKRQQIDDANKQMMIWVASAAAIVTICAMLAINLTQHIMYQAKVIGEKSKTDTTLKNNLKAIPKLMTNINALQTNSDLLALRAGSNDTAFNVVIDALPTSDDKTALGSSMQEKILAHSGVELVTFDPSYSSSSTTTQTTTNSTESSVKPSPQPIAFGFSISGNYESIKTALADIEKTIRPIIINSIIIGGTDDQLTATISATTYYVPKVSYVLGSKQVLPDGAKSTTTTTTTSGGTK